MKNKAKYSWMIGATPPMLDQHSKVKHTIIESYVRQYIQTLMSRAMIPRLQLTLVDGFSGGGAYREITNKGEIEVDGSPILMMRAVREARFTLNEFRQVNRDVVVDYHFIDSQRDTTNYLTHRLDEKLEEAAIDQRDRSRVQVSTAQFERELPNIIKAIKRRKGGERAIFLLDQYGYRLPISKVATILSSLKNAEVLLTFNVGSLISFISEHNPNRKAIKAIDLESYIPWESLSAIKGTRQWRQILQRHLAHGIREVSGARFATLFFVRPDQDAPWDYWLIHLSNHYKAHEVMKDLHWKHATVFGHELEPGVFIQGYDPRGDEAYTCQGTFDFGESARSECIAGIHEYFGQEIYRLDRPTRLRDLIESCATCSPGSTQHFTESLNSLHRSRDVIILSPDGKTRDPQRSKKYHLDSIIEPVRNFRLDLSR